MNVEKNYKNCQKMLKFVMLISLLDNYSMANK